MHRRPSVPLCCPVRRLACAARIEPSGLIFHCVVSLHRRTSFRFCCPAWPLRLASHDRPSGLSFDRPVSLRLRLDLRFCFPADVRLAPSPNRSASPSALLVSLRRELRFQICLPASPFGLRFLVRPFSLAFRPADGLAPSTELPALPSCLCRFDLRLAAGLPALPSYLTANLPAAFLLRRCPRVSRWLSPLVPPRAHPSDSNFRRCRLSPLRLLHLIKSWLSP